jgi:hypothetical protein
MSVVLLLVRVLMAAAGQMATACRERPEGSEHV